MMLLALLAVPAQIIQPFVQYFEILNVQVMSKIYTYKFFFFILMVTRVTWFLFKQVQNWTLVGALFFPIQVLGTV
jgi:hypothetical protein